jgi:hypothetical protein
VGNCIEGSNPFLSARQGQAGGLPFLHPKTPRALLLKGCRMQKGHSA